MPTSGILWEGPSPQDKSPIMAICTDRSRNAKTGPAIQVWILRSDMNPMDAVVKGKDTAICGNCAMRGEGLAKRSCYVNVARAPMAVFKKYTAGGYAHILPQDLRGMIVRWGAYGDPAMIPTKIVKAVNKVAYSHTGYTHQWLQPYARWTKGIFMASVESVKAETKAQKAGWGTFRVGNSEGTDQGEAIMCTNAEVTGVTCTACLKCDGRKLAVFIPAHGVGAKYVPASALLRKVR